MGMHYRPCDMCGKRMRTSLESPRCQSCRKSAWNRTCPTCGIEFVRNYGRFCSMACRPAPKQIRASDDKRVLRGKRELLAEGLTRRQRDILMAKWKKQGRMCAYWPRVGCKGLADTVDHMLPLVRGGTNYEGNLVPACKSCNSSKGGLTVIEWRTGKRLPRMTGVLRSPRKPRPKAVKPLGTPVQLEMRLCVACGALHLRRSAYCSEGCNARSAYRLRVGIPIEAAPYSARASGF